MEYILLKIFGVLLVCASFLVITANNPVHSVISLVFVFFNCAAIFFILGFEYLALVLLIVYVGAIAVLFLFVVMMLNIKKGNIARFSGLIGLLLFLILYLFASIKMDSFIVNEVVVINWANEFFKVTDMELIGQLLFTYYFIYVLLAGLILLVAMVGSILLTMVHSPFVKRQVIFDQLGRVANASVKTWTLI
jgi:NADH-quinone oxidoreductase subunit J